MRSAVPEVNRIRNSGPRPRASLGPRMPPGIIRSRRSTSGLLSNRRSACWDSLGLAHLVARSFVRAVPVRILGAEEDPARRRGEFGHVVEDLGDMARLRCGRLRLRSAAAGRNIPSFLAPRRTAEKALVAVIQGGLRP